MGVGCSAEGESTSGSVVAEIDHEHLVHKQTRGIETRENKDGSVRLDSVRFGSVQFSSVSVSATVSVRAQRKTGRPTDGLFERCCDMEVNNKTQRVSSSVVYAITLMSNPRKSRSRGRGER